MRRMKKQSWLNLLFFNRTIEQMIDDIIVAALELDRKDYGCQIDRILLGLLDLKRSVIHSKAV